jgi:prolyl 4-hydroxylase
MNEADSLFEQAANALRGVGGKRDLAAARDLFRRSAEAGRIHAAVIHANFVAAGVGAPAEWQRGLFLLRNLAAIERRARIQLALIAAMKLNVSGDPVAPPVAAPVCERPHIVRFESFFTPDECRYLTVLAGPMLEPSVVVDAATGRQMKDPVRTSDGIGFPWPLEDPLIHALNRRIAAASGTDVAQGEPLQVLRYRPGDQYRTHFDAIPGFANQRILTMIVWLTDGYGGGETFFRTPGLRLKGKVGDAILFRNAGPDGRPDPDAAHSGLPVTAGQKWIASRWIRARPFDLPIEGAA